ncbi:MAG: recombination mediator RecR [Patescibacteria group bacterium]|nr:MAG: recombination mediator RecR [Patescibacteria group bacterium]
MNSIEKLAEYFAKFPGIGGRQAKRFVYFLLAQDRHFSKELAALLLDVRRNVRQCSRCRRFYLSPSNEVEETICDVCRNLNTEKTLLMVVEKDIDFENIRKMGLYDGRFFILGGSLPLLEKNPDTRIRVKELFGEVQRAVQDDGLKEIILALSVNPEGENAALYIKKVLGPLAEKFSLKISTLGRGLSTGTELEYSDSDTLGNALKNRG